MFLYIIIAICILIFIYMMFIEQFCIRVRHLEFGFRGLPKEFDGFKILHLSDLHIKKYGLLEKRLIELLKKEKVDIVISTGDITAWPRAADLWRRICSFIQRDGLVYTVLGNSEHKPWLDPTMMADALSFEGQTMLFNESTIIKRGDSQIVLVGVNDPYSKLDDTKKAFENIIKDDFVIFLTHSPDPTPEAIEYGANIILSGHTHGGQVRFPFIKNFWTHMKRNKFLNDGIYNSQALKKLLKIETNDVLLFVNRGVGTSRIHIRLLCPPEIVYITLKSI